MRASTADLNQSEERLKEYQRQHERLKAMTTNADRVKSLSADIMIENLLKQSFGKPNSNSFENKTNSGSGLPNWLDCESAELPAVYKHLWAFVKTPTGFADTQKVSKLLLTSGLHTEVLGFIWNLSNKAVPGQLNKQEFYIILALVALAQTGYTFNNLSILNLIPNVPIPTLQTKVLEKYIRSPAAPNITYASQIGPVGQTNEETFSSSQLPSYNTGEHSLFNMNIASTKTSGTANEPLKDVGELKMLKMLSKSSSKDLIDHDSSRDFPKTSQFPCIGSSPTAELEDEDEFSEFQSAAINESSAELRKEKEEPSFSTQSDEFTDFQCADIISDPLETVVISQKKEIPKIPLPRNLSGKLSNLRTNILKISPESEKKLKVLTQSETLSTLPESKISTNNKVSTVAGISVLPGSRDVGLRLANHSFGAKTDRLKHQRHKHKQQSVHVDEMMFSSKFGTMDELFPKCFQKSSGGSKTFVLKETKIGNPDSMEPESSSNTDGNVIPDLFPPPKNTRKIEIPMLGTFNETTLPTQSENVCISQPTVELFSVEEDKYSALREVELEMKLKNNDVKQCEENTVTSPSDGMDDFGEFLSAEIPCVSTEETDLWGEWRNPDPLPSTESETIGKPLESFNNVMMESGLSRIDKDQKNVEVSASELNFDLLSLSEDDNMKIISTTTEFHLDTLKNCKNKTELDVITSTSESAPEEPCNKEEFDDFMMLSSPRNNDSNQCSNRSSLPSARVDDDFEMFFTNEFNPPLQESTKYDLLPSLNLKMLPSEGSEPETIRTKCLMACLNLIRQGLDIFNGVSCNVILKEVLSTEEAVNYLNNLNVVYQISKRVGTNSGEGLSIQEDIEIIWQKLIRYCCDYHVPLKEDLDNVAQIGSQCHVCLGFIGNDIVDRGISCYHPSCANLWVNCVESELP